MNYLCAPFFLVKMGQDEVYQCLTSLISTLLPNTFNDDEFWGLQCVFSLFRLLLMYNDPELALFLDKYDMGPELYASSWYTRTA
jgi:hypothetical protein